MPRAHREPAVAELGQHLADRAFVQRNPEAPLQFVAQIHPPPTHHTVTNRIGAGLDQGLQRRGLFGRQFRLGTRRLEIVQTAEPFGVVAMHPVPQRLPIHPAGLGRRRAIRPVQHQRDRQHPTRRRTVLLPRRRRAKLQGRQISTPNPNRRTHRCSSFSRNSIESDFYSLGNP